MVKDYPVELELPARAQNQIWKTNVKTRDVVKSTRFSVSFPLDFYQLLVVKENHVFFRIIEV